MNPTVESAWIALRGHVQLGRGLVGGGLAAEVLEHLPLSPGQLADGLGYVRGEADGAGLVGHRARDRRRIHQVA
jgi:hypothetical protein